MRHIEFIDIRLHVAGEFLEVVRRKRLLPKNHHRCAGCHADRREIDRRIIGKVRIERDRSSVRAHMAHLDGVAVGRGLHRTD